LTNKDLKKAEIDVVENVKKAYFGVLVNQQRIRLAGANLSRIDTLLKETTALNEAGFVEKIDVSRVQVQRNNTFTQVQRSQTALEISKQILKLQLGIPAEYEVELVETLQDLSTKEALIQLLGEVGTDRIEIEQVATQITLVGLDLKNNVSQYMPKIDFIGNTRKSGAGNELDRVFNKSNWFGSSLVGLNMSIPIFDGFSKAARIQKNRVQLTQLENQRSFLKESFNSELYAAKANLRNDLNILEVQEANLQLATEVYQIARIKYKEGIGSNLEVVNADASLIEAEINYLGALYDGLISKINLEKALGLLQPDLTN
jgi:outer membrane protein TolC